MTKCPAILDKREAMIMDVRKQVLQIIADQAMLDVADVSMESTPEDLGIDSLGLVEAIFSIEEQFDISVPFNANDPTESDFDISSVAKIVEGIEKLITEQTS